MGVHTVRRLTSLNDENGPNWGTGVFGAVGVNGNSLSAPAPASTPYSIPPMWSVWSSSGGYALS
jgi:hypothetical protein